MARTRLGDLHPDNSGPLDEDPYRGRLDSPLRQRIRRIRGSYGEGYSENIQQEASDLREQMQRAVQEAASEHIGEPLNDQTRAQLSTTVSQAIIDSMNNTSDRVDRVMGTVPGSTPMTNRTLESGLPMMHSINMEMTVVNTNGVAKDEHGNPLFCYGCAGSAADVSFPSYSVEWRCSNCIRCTNEEMTSLEKEDTKAYDKYINVEYSQKLEEDTKAFYKEQLKKEVIEELNTDKTILTGQKLKRLINGKSN